MGDVEQPGVVAEIHLGEFGVLGQSEGAEEQRFLMLDEVVGEIEGADFARVLGKEALDAGKEGVAMIAGKALSVGEPVEQSVEVSARSAIAVSDQDRLVVVGSFDQYGFDRWGDFFWAVMEVSWEVFEVHVVPTVGGHDGANIGT